jgi:hypothetical protein
MPGIVRRRWRGLTCLLSAGYDPCRRATALPQPVAWPDVLTVCGCPPRRRPRRGELCRPACSPSRAGETGCGCAGSAPAAPLVAGRGGGRLPRSTTAIVSASSVSFGAVPPWSACRERAGPRTQGSPACAHRAASPSQGQRPATATPSVVESFNAPAAQASRLWKRCHAMGEGAPETHPECKIPSAWAITWRWSLSAWPS